MTYRLAKSLEYCFSTARHIFTGVRQGSCLLPTLYLTYVNSIPNTHKGQLALFTDEAISLTQNKNAKCASASKLIPLNP